MKLRKIALWALPAALMVGACNEDEKGDENNNQNGPEGYTLVWADEFDGSDLNTNNWTFETGDGTDYGLPEGWGNNELQIYTNSTDNAYLTSHGGENVLAITALKNGPDDYTSAKLTTEGLHSMLYGRLEIRAKVPQGQGLWPALWMLGDNRPVIDWPGCGEIDIMEVLGHQTDKMYTTLHFVKEENKKGELQDVHELGGPLFSDDFHVYGVEWTPTEIKFLLDGNMVYKEPITTYMKEFQRPFYAILNLAVGGFWPGNPDATTPFPATLYVDYVRYYAIDNLNAPSPPALDPDEERLGPLLDTNLANALVKDGFTDFGKVEMTVYGGGGEPALRLSDTAVDGDFSLVYDFPGGSWGGAFVEMENPLDLSNFTNLVFAINAPANLDDAEIKLEGLTQATSDNVMLKDYTPVALADGFVEYTIPLNDFTNLDQNQVRIPFAMWNVVDASAAFTPATIYIDKVHFSN
jgi:beta-glucanase (GH16 family)